jgi:hypothetical protein
MKEGGSQPYSVPVHDDGGVLRVKYLHDLEDSVKARTPIAGVGLSIIKTNIGSVIGLSTSTTCQILEFNVCSNGTPDKIALLAVVTKPGIDLYDPEIPISYSPISTVA